MNIRGGRVLEAAGLYASIPAATAPRILLRDLSLTVRESESIAILGRSGSGKSTLLSILGLMQRPDSGTLTIAGRDSSELSDAVRARMRNELLGFVFQSYSLIGDLNVFDNVALPLRYATRASAKTRRERVMTSLESVGLGAFSRSKPLHLSGGEQQRVAIARALVRQPRIVLADEPTGALDTQTGSEVIDLLRTNTARAGSCLIVVTHDTEIASRMNRQMTLYEGSLTDDAQTTGPARCGQT